MAKVSETVVESTHLVLPSDANALGSVFGGQVCSWIDLACAMSAMRHCRRPCVTASMDNLDFLAGIKVGHMAIVRSQVNAVFNKSMEVGCEVWSEDPYTGERFHTSTAFLTFVAIDSYNRTVVLPPLICETPEEKQRESEAIVRRQERLARKAVAKK